MHISVQTHAPKLINMAPGSEISSSTWVTVPVLAYLAV